MDRIRPASLIGVQLVLVLHLTGCASAQNPNDPFEPFNRGVYKFNDTVDKAVLKPVAQAYDFVMPTQLRIMAGNFISNLDDVVVTFNDVLQLKFSQAASDGSRVIFNTTFGVLGLFDVASSLEKHHEDFGQTLGHWGVGSGPYLVLPFLGPSTLRDAPSLYVDAITGVEGHVDNVRARNQYYLASFIHKRASLLDEEKVLDEAAIDRYAFIRDAYLLRRKNQVYDVNPPREKYYYDE